nr:MAG TPA: hypothetical protein [Caudoviricetes sp.]
MSLPKILPPLSNSAAKFNIFRRRQSNHPFLLSFYHKKLQGATNNCAKKIICATLLTMLLHCANMRP